MYKAVVTCKIKICKIVVKMFLCFILHLTTSKMFLKCFSVKHLQKCFRAVDFPRLCFILHLTTAYLQHMFNMLKAFADFGGVCPERRRQTILGGRKRRFFQFFGSFRVCIIGSFRSKTTVISRLLFSPSSAFHCFDVRYNNI